MYKQVFTLLRSSAHEAAEQFTDTNALPILRQQIRDSARSIQASKCAIAAAMAQYQAEIDHHQIIADKITDLEERALVALDQNQDELAQEAAEVLASLEEENDTSLAAQQMFRNQIGGLKSQLREAQSILRELQRGERLAAAAHSTRGLNTRGAGCDHSSLTAARETLQRLQARQSQHQRKVEAMAELNRTANPDSVTEKLAKAGCGKPVKKSADGVLDRLRAKAKKSKKSGKS
ncbi:MAG: PspA/IM30 family protein [Rhizobiaceae bacterium]|nr:PspA/IM30 family protein [Rhizobiaceae bacterium]